MKCKMGGEPGTVNGLTWNETETRGTGKNGNEKNKGEKVDTNERE